MSERAQDPPDRLAELIESLEHVARRLRAEDLEPADAARLVEDCAREASAAAAELERAARGPGPGPAAPPTPAA